MSLDRYVGHIKHLRERLWVPGAHGRAAVLVGAGFSRNADPVLADAPEFALLSNYTEVFAGALGRNPNDAKFIPIERLAEEYEASFGREALNNQIQRLIPWTSYQPGKLHEKLLRLPWADVFTTNYDPLLEDARRLVPLRRYDLVVHPDDLPNAQRPRIVKLHGSFPSTRPFVFTEEDFRYYPRRFAPFVNAVQQGMVENTLCLLGFEGDDPNFLRWAGWVRDELGEHRPLIYLVNILKLNEARRRYLEKRQIIPIDLGEILQFDKHMPMSEQFKRANDWFLESLQNGRPEDLLDWPRVSPERKKEDYDYPHCPLPVRSREVPPRSLPEIDSTLQEFYLYWRERRESYPGLEVFPARRHQRLSDRGEASAYIALENQKLPPPLDLLLLRELVWRRKVRNALLEPELVAEVEKRLDQYAPFASGGVASEGEFTPQSSPLFKVPADWTLDGQGGELHWQEIRVIWIELALAVLAVRRMDLNVEGFREWSRRIQCADLSHYPNWEAQWHWEQVGFAIDLLNAEEAKRHLMAWPDRMGHPFWEVRRAAALWEVGLLVQARAAFSGAAERLRAGQQPGQHNLRLLSQLAWAKLLGGLLRQHQLSDSYPDEGQADGHGRKNGELNPQDDLRFWTSGLLKMYQEISREATTLRFQREFDVGKALLYYGSSPEESSQTGARSATGFLRFLDWAGCPLSAVSDLQPAVLLLSHRSTAPRAILTSIRTGDKNTLNGLLSRDRVAALPPDHAEFLIHSLSAAITSALDQAREMGSKLGWEDEFIRHILLLGVEALSRMLLRANSEQVKAALRLAVQLANLPAIQEDFNFYDPLNSLVTRTLDGWPADDLDSLVAQLAEFPLPPDVVHFGNWPRPLEHSRLREAKHTGEGRRVSAETVARLIGMVASEEPKARIKASITLHHLYRWNDLDEREARRYGEALWQTTDPRTHLPMNTGLMEFAFLRAPTPAGMEPERRVRSYYLSDLFFEIPLDPNILGGSDYSVLTVEQRLDSLLGSFQLLKTRAAPELQWSREELQRLFQNLKGLWPRWVEYVTTSHQLALRWPPHGERVQKTTHKVLEVIHEGIVLHHDIEGVRAFAGAVEEQMRGWGFGIRPQVQRNSEQAVDTVITNLLGSKYRMVEQAVMDAARVMIDSKPEPHEALRHLLISRVIHRTPLALDAVLKAIATAMREGVKVLEPDELPLVLTSLDYLADETALTPEDLRLLGREGRTARSDIRAAASAFVATLLQQAETLQLDPQELDVHPTVQKWRDIGKDDPLPEVRSPWGSQGRELDREG